LLEIFYRRVYTGDFYRPKPGDLVIDAGANIGVFSIHIHRLCPQTEVVAYEPFPDNYAYLKKNLQAANATNVTAHCKALGVRTGSSLIQKVGGRSQDHRVIDAVSTPLHSAENHSAENHSAENHSAENHSAENHSAENHGAEDTTRVDMVPFSHMFEGAKGRSISLLKCDIEGSELDLFRSATPEQLQQIDRIAIEFHDHLVPGTSDELIKILKPTHDVQKQTENALGYGMLYGTRRSK
jgi:FkbM family methyltransferase